MTPASGVHDVSPGQPRTTLFEPLSPHTHTHTHTHVSLFLFFTLVDGLSSPHDVGGLWSLAVCVRVHFLRCSPELGGADSFSSSGWVCSSSLVFFLFFFFQTFSVGLCFCPSQVRGFVTWRQQNRIFTGHMNKDNRIIHGKDISGIDEKKVTLLCFSWSKVCESLWTLLLQGLLICHCKQKNSTSC